jgi:hypothetical protein
MYVGEYLLEVSRLVSEFVKLTVNLKMTSFYRYVFTC